VNDVRRHVLLIDVDERRTRALVEHLGADGYGVRVARSEEHARLLARDAPPAIVLFGRLEPASEPSRQSLSLLEEIRKSRCPSAFEPATPAIVIGSRTHELDVLRAFEAGADDYLRPSAGYLELRARLRALERRTSRSGSAPARVDVDSLSIDTRAHATRLEGRPLALRHLEYELLLHLAREPRRVFTKRELLAAVWGHTTPLNTRTLDSHASRLRRKLGDADGRSWVVNVRGVGYRLI
jgi:DNA-binding response OmpR family regulator